MKKIYIQPTCDVVRLEIEGTLLKTSDLTVDSENRSEVILNNRKEDGWNSELWSSMEE